MQQSFLMRPGWGTFVTDDRVNYGDHTGLTTSLGLLERVRARDSVAWERLVTLYSPLVDHWCRVCRVPEQEWPDLRQEVFLAVSRTIGSFRKETERGTFRGWLRTITRSKVTDLHRRRPVDGTVVGPVAMAALADPNGNADDESAELERGVVYNRVLALLERDFTPSTWRAFWLVVVEERDPIAVAEELRITANAVYLAKARVLRRLREEFGDLLEPPPDTD